MIEATTQQGYPFEHVNIWDAMMEIRAQRKAFMERNPMYKPLCLDDEEAYWYESDGKSAVPRRGFEGAGLNFWSQNEWDNLVRLYEQGADDAK